MNDETKTDEVEENEKQTAVAEGTDEAPKQETSEEGGAAQDDDGLDALLAEFEERGAAASKKEAVTSPQTKSEPKDTTSEVDVAALATLEERLNQQEAREQRRELEKLFSRVSSGTQGDEIDAEAFLNTMALRDPRLTQAYYNRNSNPKKWADVEKALKQEFQKRHGKKVDKNVTESRDAVASAVRSAQSAAPQKEYSDKDIVGMSKDEFDSMQRKLGVTPA